MIVRNEERNLPAGLDTVADLVQEIIIVDTGSTDRTREVAARYGAAGCSSFPGSTIFRPLTKACGMRTASGFSGSMPDDRLDAENRERLRNLLAGLDNENVSYMMQCVSLPNDTTGAATIVDHVRRFQSSASSLEVSCARAR